VTSPRCAEQRTLPGQRPTLDSLGSNVWDAVVIGGGITGAGILLEAARRGLFVLLVEQRDFAWGTSSRSSKMVHGGLRYIAQGEVRLTQHSLQERERLLAELPGLVQRMRYIFPIYKGKFPGRWPLTLILALYDWLAGIHDRRWLSRTEMLNRYPDLLHHNLRGGMSYTDALTDDSRLVIRVLQEAMCEGQGERICARTYTEVTGIEPVATGSRLTLKDSDSGATTTIEATHVFNATGLWADRLSGTAPLVRPLRGSHLFIPAQRLPVQDCLSFMHPDDGRPVFIFPWKGQTCIGTTDLDHQDKFNEEPTCSNTEIDYLLKVTNNALPHLQLGRADIISTMAGVRPIIASGKGMNPSKERRNHLVWQARGVVSVSGGKLTTFRQIALDALHAAGLIDAAEHRRAHRDRTLRCFNHTLPDPQQLSHPMVGMAQGAALLEQVAWILEHEMVTHLDDLLLRRLRAGSLMTDAGRSLLPEIKPLCQARLDWSEQVWQSECARYIEIIERCYRTPKND